MLRTAFEKARKKVDSLRNHQASKGEKALNSATDTCRAVSDSTCVTVARGIASTVDFSAVKEQVSNFKDNCKILVDVLDKVSSLHPFVAAAVIAFKTGVQLEITRRENDDRVLALNTTMCEMMSVLKPLLNLEEDQRKREVKENLEERMSRVVQSIKYCAELCDSYQRERTVVKFFTGFKWQPRFTALAEEFAEHRNALQLALSVFVVIEISSTNSLLSDVFAMMKMVFDRMQPGKERRLAEFIRRKGGNIENPDNELLVAVTDYEQRQQENENDEDEDVKITKGGLGKDKRVSVRLEGVQPAEMPAGVRDLRKEIQKDIETILEENRGRFEQQFNAMEIRLKEELKEIIIRENVLVIETIKDVPHEKIRDRDVHHVWRDMGWKGSVKAVYLVMALHDHFSAKLRDAPTEKYIKDNVSTKKARPEQLPPTPPEDRWALKYISIDRVQPLIEALDEDGSSYITVSEVNTFTSSRPEGWSLPKWIAYWTVGFEMITHWYYRRICRLLSLITRSSRGVLPANWGVVSDFLNSWSARYLQNHLSGLQRVKDWDSMDWDDNYVFLKFKDWVVDTERKMEEILEKLVYYIDQDNVLYTVTGGGRAEKYMMPVFYLLLKRCHSIMEQGHNQVLHPKEFQILLRSMRVVQNAIQERVRKLQAIYTLQNINKEEKLRSIFFGLYAYTFDTPENGESWKRDISFYDTMPDLPRSDSVPAFARKLYYESSHEELGAFDTYQTTEWPSLLASTLAMQGDPTVEDKSLIGVWSGSNPPSDGVPTGLISLSITQHTSDGRFHGSGIGISGPFSIDGRLRDDEVLFLTLQGSGRTKLRFQGRLSEDQMMVSGSWGHPLFDKEEEMLTKVGSGPEKPGDADREAAGSVTTPVVKPPDDVSIGEGEKSNKWNALGTFVLNRCPVDYALCRPTDEEFRGNRSRTLWAWLRNAVQLHQLSWEGIRERRDKRKTFFKLLKVNASGQTFIQGADIEEWTKLVQSTRPRDLCLWYGMARLKPRRKQVHNLSIRCDHCRSKPLPSTRILCIECSRDESNSIDLCADCRDMDVYRDRDQKDHRSASHPRLQLRWPLLKAQTYPIMANATSRLQSTSAEVVKWCLQCEEKLTERPYWQCVECEGATFLCIKCNELDEQRKLWLYQREVTPEGKHQWMHPLVLHPKETLATTKQRVLTTDERLDKMEARLQALEDKVAILLPSRKEILEMVLSANGAS
ncbi:hypothetical protein V5O48_013758 [Marasmius crinis-equi]|uniref:EF-hand domain-containing protein n=1 Tax=Marasmius crinis-equi TaxID=585013 RepID=A0ABR3EZB8_9AGAR